MGALRQQLHDLRREFDRTKQYQATRSMGAQEGRVGSIPAGNPRKRCRGSEAEGDEGALESGGGCAMRGAVISSPVLQGRVQRVHAKCEKVHECVKALESLSPPLGGSACRPGMLFRYARGGRGKCSEQYVPC